MAMLSIPAEGSWGQAGQFAQPTQPTGLPGQPPRLQAGHGRPARTVAQTSRAGLVWGQRALLALALVLFLTLAVLPRLGLYRPVTVLSGSMRPTFSPGDMVIVTPEPVGAVRVGQVISYQVPVGVHQVETHRVVRILQGGAHPIVQTQGDANNWPDPWTARLEGATAWRMVAVVPHLGYVVNFLRGHTLRMAAIFVAPALLALLLLSEIWGFGGRDGDSEGAEGSARRPPEQVDGAGLDPQRQAGQVRRVPPIPLVEPQGQRS